MRGIPKDLAVSLQEVFIELRDEDSNVEGLLETFMHSGLGSK